MGLVDSASWRDVASRHYRWEAFDLVAAGHHELGVVAAQVHLEAQLRFALRRAALDVEMGDVELERALAGVARPTDAPVSEALASVLRVDLESAELVRPLDDHLARVSGVLEGATRISREEAQASLEVIDALWAEIARAASVPAPVGVPGVDTPPGG